MDELRDHSLVIVGPFTCASSVIPDPISGLLTQFQHSAIAVFEGLSRDDLRAAGAYAGAALARCEQIEVAGFWRDMCCSYVLDGASSVHGQVSLRRGLSRCCPPENVMHRKALPDLLRVDSKTLTRASDRGDAGRGSADGHLR